MGHYISQLDEDIRFCDLEIEKFIARNPKVVVLMELQSYRHSLISKRGFEEWRNKSSQRPYGSISPAAIKRFIKLHDAGMTFAHIGRISGVSKNVVQKVIEKEKLRCEEKENSDVAQITLSGVRQELRKKAREKSKKRQKRWRSRRLGVFQGHRVRGLQ